MNYTDDAQQMAKGEFFKMDSMVDYNGYNTSLILNPRHAAVYSNASVSQVQYESRGNAMFYSAKRNDGPYGGNTKGLHKRSTSELSIREAYQSYPSESKMMLNM